MHGCGKESTLQLGTAILTGFYLAFQIRSENEFSTNVFIVVYYYYYHYYYIFECTRATYKMSTRDCSPWGTVQKYTRAMHWDTTKNCWPSHESLLPHLSERHPRSLTTCPWLFLSVFLSHPAILHTLQGSALHPPLLAHCILYIFSSLPSPFHLPVSMRSCAVPLLSDHPPYFLAVLVHNHP